VSGWQRVGVGISVLWLIGFPIFLFIDANRSQGDVLHYCLNTASALREPTDRKATQQICFRAFEASRETPRKLVKELAADKILWTVMLGPIGVLWIIGGAISYAARRIVRRLFKGTRTGGDFGRTADTPYNNPTSGFSPSGNRSL